MLLNLPASILERVALVSLQETEFVGVLLNHKEEKARGGEGDPAGPKTLFVV